MNDIRLFGNKEDTSKEVKGEKVYWGEQDITRKVKRNRLFIYIIAASLLISIAGLGFYDYWQDKTVTRNLASMTVDFSQRISNLSQRIDALLVRVIGLEKKTSQLDMKTNENASQIGKTQQDVSQLQQGLQDANSKIVAMQYTKEDAERLALMFASQFNGIKVKTYDFNPSTNRWNIGEIAFDENSPARRVSSQVMSTEKNDRGYDVVLMLGYKGFSFTNGTLYFKMTVNVGYKGVVEGYTMVFSHG